MPLEAADIIVELKDKKEWRFKTMNDLAAAMEKVLGQVEGVNFEVQQPIEMRFNELMTGVKSDVAVKFFGSDLDSLLYLAEQFALVAPTVEGVANVKIEPVDKTPQFNIRYNRERLAHYGINVSTANKVIRMAYAGEHAGLVYDGQQHYDLVVKLEKEIRQDLTQIPNLPIKAKNGSWVPLSEIADINMDKGPSQISRDQAKRRVVVGLNIRDRDIESAVNDIRIALNKKVKLPVNYSYQIGGEFENLQHAVQRLQLTLPVTLLLIFLFLFLAFKSIKHVLLIFSAVPLATVGGIFALDLRGMPFSISAAVGFIALFGVAVLNSMLLIQQYKSEELKGNIELGKLAMASASRLRPVLITAIVASLGFLPMAISTSAGAEVQKPLATVVIGGLITSTLLTLFVLPSLFALVEQKLFKLGKGVSVLIFFFVLSYSGYAQENKVISIDEALNYAQSNNIFLKSLQKKKEGLKNMVGTGWEIPQTQLDYQRGQVQFLPIDYTFMVSQSFQLPAVYNRQKQVLEAHFEQGSLEVNLAEKNLYKEIRYIFLKHYLSTERLKLLNAQDSLLKQAITIAKVRVESGETDRLILQSIEMQLNQLEVDKELHINNLKLYSFELKELLNLKEEPILSSSLMMPLPEKGIPENHPLVDLAKQSKRVAERQLLVDKARHWPTLSLGYVNQSVEKNKNLQYGMAGLSIPLFMAPYKSRQKAAQSLVDQKNLEIEYTLLAVRNNLEINYFKANNLQKRLKLYENNVLLQSKQNMELARKRWTAGQLDFFQFLLIVEQGWKTQSNAIEIVEEWQKTLIDLAYLESK